MIDKFEKKDTCLYCGNTMDAKYRSKRFCSDRCRTYWNRENKPPRVKDLTRPTNEIKPKEQPKTNYSVNTKIPPMPVRMDGEDSIDFATRKNEWKKLYNK